MLVIISNTKNKNFLENKNALKRFNSLIENQYIVKMAKKSFIVIKNITYSSFSKILEAVYGNKDIRPDLEKYIKDLAQDAGMSTGFKVKQISQEFLNQKPGSKAFTYFNHLFIDEKYLNSLSEQEKKALIGHELGHIHFGHTYQKLLCFGADLTLTGISAIGVLFHAKPAAFELINRKFKPINISTLAGELTFIAFLKDKLHDYSSQKVQNQEFESDQFAVERFDNKAGMISLLKNIDQDRINSSLQKLNNQNGHGIHPSNSDRISRLIDADLTDQDLSDSHGLHDVTETDNLNTASIEKYIANLNNTTVNSNQELKLDKEFLDIYTVIFIPDNKVQEFLEELIRSNNNLFDLDNNIAEADNHLVTTKDKAKIIIKNIRANALRLFGVSTDIIEPSHIAPVLLLGGSMGGTASGGSFLVGSATIAPPVAVGVAICILGKVGYDAAVDYGLIYKKTPKHHKKPFNKQPDRSPNQEINPEDPKEKKDSNKPTIRNISKKAKKRNYAEVREELKGPKEPI